MLRKNAKIELLRRVPLFSECSKAQLADIAMIADEIDIREGTVLIAEGSPGREFFIVLEGTVAVSRNGKKLPLRGGGEFFGEISLISDALTNATVAASSPLRILVITARSFKRLLEGSPAIQRKLMSAMAARLAPETL
jgi:CRP/FNR family cyclic AMP-dependent transcriptional regulator